MTYRYFADREVEGLSPSLVTMLDEARSEAKVPFVITSGLRLPDSNPGVENSSHLRGLGVDLACSASRSRFFMLSALLKVGFNRVGIYDRHLHVDSDPSLPQQVIWWGRSS